MAELPKSFRTPRLNRPLLQAGISRRSLLCGMAAGLAACHSRAVCAAEAETTIQPPPGLQPIGQAEVIRVHAGDILTLSTGEAVSLLGIQAPKQRNGDDVLQAWPYADQAKQALEQYLLNRNVYFAQVGAPMDRKGLGLFHLVRDDGNWVQGWMVRNGHARVYGYPKNRQFLRELQMMEVQARAEKLGLWNLPLYQIRDASNPKGMKPYGMFHLIEGSVVTAANVSGRIYLNFGADYRTDFTATLEADTLRRFPGEWPDFSALTGRRLRLRGWVYLQNGPIIDVTYPEQIELIG
jgi:micrococcal nuclease